MDHATAYKIGTQLNQQNRVELDVDGCFQLINQSERIKDKALKLSLAMMPAGEICEALNEINETTLKAIILRMIAQPEVAVNDLFDSLYLELEHIINEALAEVMPGIIADEVQDAMADHAYDANREAAA